MEVRKTNQKGFGDLKQFHEAPILHVWGLSFELRRREWKFETNYVRKIMKQNNLKASLHIILR